MSAVIYHVPDLVTVTWEENLEAIVIKWDTLYREDTGIREALETCFDYVRRNGVKNWVADVRQAKAQLSEADQQWASEYFNNTIATLGLETFVLVTAPGEDEESSHIEEWLEEARREIGDSLRMHRATSMDVVPKIIEGRTPAI